MGNSFSLEEIRIVSPVEFLSHYGVRHSDRGERSVAPGRLMNIRSTSNNDI